MKNKQEAPDLGKLIEQPEKEVTTIRLEDLDLAELNWRKTEESSDIDNIDVYRFKTTLSINGEQFPFSAQRRHYLESCRAKPGSEEYLFKIGEDSTGRVTMKAEIRKGAEPDPDNDAVIEASLIRQDENGILPKGIGMKLYEKNLHLFDSLSKSRRKSYLHRLYKATEISSPPLSPERWDELFLPILHRWGYQKSGLRVGMETWTRLYDGRK